MAPAQQSRSAVDARIRARRSAVQACYQWYMTRKPIEEVILEFEAERTEIRRADAGYFREMLRGLADNIDVINTELGSCLDRKIDRLDPVELAILHLGVYELKFQPLTPWRVVVNESVELAKMFGAEQSHRYINGVLDKVARQVRVAEVTGNH